MVDAVGVENKSRNLESRKQKFERQRRKSYQPGASPQEHGANMVKQSESRNLESRKQKFKTKNGNLSTRKAD